MIIFQNSEFLALSYLRQGFNPLVMYPTYTVIVGDKRNTKNVYHPDFVAINLSNTW